MFAVFNKDGSFMTGYNDYMENTLKSVLPEDASFTKVEPDELKKLFDEKNKAALSFYDDAQDSRRTIESSPIIAFDNSTTPIADAGKPQTKKKG